MLKAKGLPRWF
jgi:hypothetical protein